MKPEDVSRVEEWLKDVSPIPDLPSAATFMLVEMVSVTKLADSVGGMHNFLRILYLISQKYSVRNN